MELTTGRRLHGFAVRYVQPLTELHATLYRMEYEKNGADLVWLDRGDDNKTFSIAFKTIPQDDTGVFHILEHSVLCGSEKYPVKEPFVELLKSSLQTFLNAMTFPDKTMYPVCSRNEQDFLNLMDVYLDAVFHPLSISDPTAFRQEGWHYELEGADGALRRNGVVYNEMKGAFSDPDQTLMAELNRLLFPHNCYGYVSGGHPDHIPELTYEHYLANHAKYYHPSNARIFLDGQVDLDKALSKLDSFLAPYDRLSVDADIPMQAPVSPAEFTTTYEISPAEDPTDKVLLAAGWMVGSFAERERAAACGALCQLLCASNEAPLKKALLERGLAQDVVLLNMGESIQQPYVMLLVRNTTKENKNTVWNAVTEVLTGLVESGLDHDRLHAILNQMEFSAREKDFGTMPRGLVYAMETLDSWLYGGDPAQPLLSDELFRSLREKIDEGWFEALLRSVFLENPHQAKVCLLPSPTLGEERRKAEEAELARIKAGWTVEEIETVKAEFDALRARQAQPDTPEQIATLPTLSLSDIPEETPRLRSRAEQLDGTTLLYQDIDTDGIAYLDLYFAVDDLPLETLELLPLLGEVLGDLATEHYSPLELLGEIEGKLGRFSVRPKVFAKRGQNVKCEPYLVVSLSLLESRKQDALTLLREVLLTTKFDDRAAVSNRLRQSRISLEQAIRFSGNLYAVQRAASSFSASNTVEEHLLGISQLRWRQKQEKSFETDGAALCGALADLCRTVFVRERVVLSFTGKRDDLWLRDVLSALPSGVKGNGAEYVPLNAKAEGFLVSADIGYAARSGSLSLLGSRRTGAARVAANLLTLDYLWNTVRVKGGAYGVSLNVRDDGQVNFSSYRDPRCGQSLEVFTRTGAALLSFCDSGEALDRYIISTIGRMEPVLTPRLEAVMAAGLYFCDITHEDRQQARSEVLHVTREQLRSFAELLNEVAQQSTVCVIGGQSAIDGCGNLLTQAESLQSN